MIGSAASTAHSAPARQVGALDAPGDRDAEDAQARSRDRDQRHACCTSSAADEWPEQQLLDLVPADRQRLVDRKPSGSSTSSATAAEIASSTSGVGLPRRRARSARRPATRPPRGADAAASIAYSSPACCISDSGALPSPRSAGPTSGGLQAGERPQPRRRRHARDAAGTPSRRCASSRSGLPADEKREEPLRERRVPLDFSAPAPEMFDQRAGVFVAEVVELGVNACAAPTSAACSYQ